MRKFGFYVSGNATRLKHLLMSSYHHIVGFVLIDTTLNKELKSKCSELDIPYYEYSYKELQLIDKQRNRFISDKFLHLLKKHQLDYGVIFGGKILEGKLSEEYKDRLINFHPALLPAFKGIKAIDQALQSGAIISGNTAHFIDENMDEGKIIMQNIQVLQHFNNYDDYLNKQIIMLIQIHKWIEEDRLIVDDTKVRIRDANYNLSEFIPNIED